MAAVTDWSREWAFVDAFKHSRPWLTRDLRAATKESGFDFDEHGNPRLNPDQMVQTIMLRDMEGYYPAGKYVATYEGTGRVSIRKFDVARVVHESAGRIEFEVNPGNGGIFLEVFESSPEDPIRDVHVWMPGFEDHESSFHPLFLERIRAFGVIRFMDWQRTNGSQQVDWSQRAKPTDGRYANNAGVPVELMVELANELQAHAWFCMPHRASDEYVLEFAKLVKDELDPRLRVYLEYSNEVWNTMFPQADYAREMGRKLNLSDNDFQSQLFYYSKRSVEIFEIWKTVFRRKGRLVRVVASQSVNPWVSEQVLSHGSAYRHADALAIAPYFGNDYGSPTNQEKTLSLSVNRLIDGLANEVKTTNAQAIRQQLLVARRARVALIAYEGGQHLAGHAGMENNQQMQQLFTEANRHSRLEQVYFDHLGRWFASGGGLYTVFSNVSRPTKWGSWGILEYQDQPLADAPKMRAVMRAIKDRKLGRRK